MVVDVRFVLCGGDGGGGGSFHQKGVNTQESKSGNI